MAGLPLAVLTAAYTAFLFAQAKARDLWQNPLLPPHFVVQAVLAGSGVLLLAAAVLEPDLVDTVTVVVAGSALVHVLMIAGEVTLPHATAHARLATFNLVRGRFSAWFWTGVVLSVVAVAAPLLPLPAAVAALAGLAAYEHAYVQAGQSVPLA